VGGHRLDDEVRVRAALLWAGEGAALSGVAAAWWHGMAGRPPSAVGVTVCRRRRPRSRAGVVVRRRDLAPADLVVHRGLALTARPLTAVEAAVELGAEGSVLLDRALQRWVRFPQVYRAYCRNLGAHGSASAGRMLVAAADRSAGTTGRLLVRLLRDAGAEGWQRAVPAAGHLVDVAFPGSRVALEVTGWAWHRDAAHAVADRRRRRALVRAGWTVLRYTWHDLACRPHGVLAEIAAAVECGSGARRSPCRLEA
jgi:very-short-patch-repair endonuclease